MKPFILTCIFAIAQFAGNCQTAPVRANDLHLINAKTFNKTCSSERISAIGYHILADTAALYGDSVHYYYSGTNGSVYNFLDLQFGYSIPEPEVDAIYGPAVHCDSAEFYYYHRTWYGQIVTTEQHSKYQYTPAGQLERSQSAGSYDSTTSVTLFNQQLPLITHDTSSNTSSGNTVFSERHYGFNNQMQLEADTAYSSASSVVLSHFQYYPNGAVSSIAHLEYPSLYWADSSWYEYDASGRPARILHFRYENNGWRFRNIDSFFYSGTNPMYDMCIKTAFDSTSSSFLANWKECRTYYANGLPDSVVAYFFDNGSWLVHHGSAMQYNSNNDPIVKTDFTIYYPWNINAPLAITNYYYEPIGTASAGSVKGNTESFTVYPNPAQGFINIRPSAGNAKNCRALMTDVSGRCVKVWNLDAADDHYRLGDLAPGIYTLVILNEKEIVHRQQVVVR